MKYILGIAPVDLSCRLKKDPGILDQPSNGNSGIGNAFITAQKVVCDQRPIGPGQLVSVICVDLAERSPHLSNFRQQPSGKCGKRYIALFQFYPLLTE